MYIVIAGAGRVGGRLATDLAEAGHDVVVIDNNADALAALGKSFDGLAVLGEAFDVDSLTEARIARADVFCAMTDDDNVNLMAAEVAKAVYGVERVLARLQDAAREGSYRALGIPYISTTRLISAVALERIKSDEFSIHVTFDAGDVDIVEFTLGLAAKGKRVADLEVEGALRVAAIRRGETTSVPASDTPVDPGDLIVAATRHGVRSRIEHLLEKSR